MTDAEALDRPSLGFDERLSLVAGMLQRFSWTKEQPSPDSMRILLGGNLSIDDAAALWKRISETVADELDGVRNLELDLTAVVKIDGACMALLTQFRSDLRVQGIGCEFSGGSGEVGRIVELYGGR